jgi:hypothetical protein
MKWLVLAVIILAQQPAKAPEGKGAAESNHTKSAAHATNAESNQAPPTKPAPAAAPASAATVSQGLTATAKDHARTGSQQTSDEDRSTQRKSTWFTGVLAGVGVLQLIVMYLTWRVYRRQAREMRRQRIAMTGQRLEMRRQRTIMQGQLGQMEGAGRQTDKLIEQSTKQTGELKAAADTALIAAQAAVENAKAAKISADIAAGVAIPTLKVEKFELGNMGNANIMAILQLPKLNIVTRNYGQSPAFLHSWSVVLTCEELPAVPAYFGHPGSGNVLDKMVVQPNEPYTLPELPYWRRQGFSRDDVKAVLDRKKMLSVYGYVCYGDIFGNPLKRLKFGEFALNIGDNWIEWCDMADPVYCGTDPYPIRGNGTKVEAEPTDEKAN